MHGKLPLLLFALSVVVVCVKAASLGDALMTVYTVPVVPEAEVEVTRDKREPFEEYDAILDVDDGRHHHSHETHHHHHHHHHNHNHHGDNVEHYTKPCKKCGGGAAVPVSSGSGATFATASAGTIPVDGHGHGGVGGQSASHAASYSFGPFSASFSASQSLANGGHYGGFF